MMKRLPRQENEWIDRERPIAFQFEGHDYTGFEGDTISSALLANGEQVLGRSFKYHRARSVLSFANHDVNIMMTDGMKTNIRADVTPLKAGMQLSVVNTSGGVRHDKKRILDKLSAILPVGFYYKAFFKPKWLFPFWEKVIRQSAGLGEVNLNYQHQPTTKTHAFTEVLIVGAGLAGMTAAIELAEAGVDVVLVDENAKLGGSLNDSMTLSAKLKALTQMITQHERIRCINNAYVAGYYADHLLPIVTLSGMIKMRAKAVIVATGAFEQPPVFRNNDLPGVMLSTAAQRLIARYGVAPCCQGVVFTANSQGYHAAMDLIRVGITIVALIDLRQTAKEPLAAELREIGVQIYQGYCIDEVKPTNDNLGVKAVTIAPYIESSIQADKTQTQDIACDGVIMSAGWSPAAALLYQAGGKLAYDETVQQLKPKSLPAGIFAAGKVNGVMALSQRALDGKRAANAVLEHLKRPSKAVIVGEHEGDAPSHPYPMVQHEKGKNFVDFDEDIQLKDFINAAQEGFNNIELMKRYTTFGMGPSQGKHGNMNAIRILSRIRQQPVDQVGSTTARPFYHPTPLSHLAGHHFTPYRQTALHAAHAAANANMSQSGAWMRPSYYKRHDLSERDCITQEVLAVREHVGLMDVSTLGKIEVIGARAAEFLERVYTGCFAQQAVGKTTYGVIIDESGVVLDDGLIARVSSDYFYVTTSTSHLAQVYREMLRYQQIWQMQDVVLNNVTSHYAAMTVAGKAAKSVITALMEGDAEDQLDQKASIQTLTLADIDVRVMRTGFVSQDSYEIHVPFHQATTLWQAILEAGQPDQIQPFGTEAQRILRLEMGHLLIGHDTDGLTNPFEAGLTKFVAIDKPFFVGQRSLQIIQKKPRHKTLVHFILDKDAATDIPKECHLVIEEHEVAGRVTSIHFSPTIEQYIGLAYVQPSQSSIGHQFHIRTDSGGMVKATVVSAPFIPTKAQHAIN